VDALGEKMPKKLSEKEISELLKQDYNPLEDALNLLKKYMIGHNSSESSTVELDAPTVEKISSIIKEELNSKNELKIKRLYDMNF